MGESTPCIYLVYTSPHIPYIPYTSNIPCMYLVYTLYIPCIYLVYTLYIPCIYLVHTLYIPCIYLVYTLYIPCIHLVYTLYAFGPNIMDIPHIVDIPHIMDILHMCLRTPKLGTSACIAEGFDGGIYTLYIPCIYLPPYPIHKGRLCGPSFSSWLDCTCLYTLAGQAWAGLGWPGLGWPGLASWLAG